MRSTKRKISGRWRVDWRKNELRVAADASQLCHKWSLNGSGEYGEGYHRPLCVGSMFAIGRGLS